MPLSAARPSTSPLDVLVAGKGPAGLAAATMLAEQGLRVGVLGPPGPVEWPAQYGAWVQELAAVGYPEIAGHCWDEMTVGLGHGARKVLPRAYARLDKERLARSLVERCEQQGVTWLGGKAVRAGHSASGSMIQCQDGTEIRARVIVDASGHRPALLDAPPTLRQGFQTAVGLTFETDDEPFGTNRAVLMDWDQSHLPPGEEKAFPPSFLYAMPLGSGLLFAEETILAGRPAVPFERLEQRLRLRLQMLGIRPRRIVEREECWIPMGGPLPRRQRVVGFGGAAGMVHPATGYLLTAVLDAAPRLAAAIARELGAPGAHPQRAADAAWDAVWPTDRRRRQELFRFGMETLLRFDTQSIQAFFATFFDLPDHDWQGYLNNRLSTRDLASVMGRIFMSVPPGVRGTMTRSALKRDGLRLASTLLRIPTA